MKVIEDASAYWSLLFCLFIYHRQGLVASRYGTKCNALFSLIPSFIWNLQNRICVSKRFLFDAKTVFTVNYYLFYASNSDSMCNLCTCLIRKPIYNTKNTIRHLPSFFKVKITIYCINSKQKTLCLLSHDHIQCNCHKCYRIVIQMEKILNLRRLFSKTKLNMSEQVRYFFSLYLNFLFTQ